MSIISAIGRKRLRSRLWLALVYILLCIGAVSTIYPFLLMVAGSTKSSVDIRFWEVIPRYWRDDTWLYRKYVESLFNESLEALHSTYAADISSFESLSLPNAVNVELVALWEEFLRQEDLPPHAFACGHLYSPVSKTVPANLRKLRRHIRNSISKNLDEVNRILGTDFPTWTAIFPSAENYLLRVRMPGTDAWSQFVANFKTEAPLGDRFYPVAELYWRQRYLPALYGRSIHSFNESHKTSYASYSDIPLPPAAPAESDPLRRDWENFVRHILNPLWIRVDSAATELYQAYLKARYQNDIALLNSRYGTAFSDFHDIPLPARPPAEGIPLVDWVAWIQGWQDPDTGQEWMVPLESLRISDVATQFREYLQSRWTCIEAFNRAVGTRYQSWSEILPPQQNFHFLAFRRNKKAIRRELTLRNYQTVVEHIAIHGRGMVNTIIYTGLSVFTALLVNPAAAYALSRFRRRSNYRILLALLLPSAFPVMITQIPVFLMLRHLNLLNTFAALILPGLANGYSIFLLKGFFDSLPRELYEHAQLDGAGELTMFRHIAMPLSKPILAVIALQAFVQAYSNFLYALLICQDPRMWTLMVWIYQLQEKSGLGVINASLVLAALPTLAVFTFCQRIILRGIIVPLER